MAENPTTTALGGFNILDILALIILAFFIILGYRKGLIRMVFDLASYGLSFYIASKLYPLVTVFLRGSTAIYTTLKHNIIDTLGIGELVSANIANGEKAVFESLPFPDFLLDKLLQSNKPNIYELLNVSGIEDYIGGYLANIVLNVISAVAVFLLVSILMRVIVAAIDILAKLPVIKSFNKAGGMLAGVVFAACSIWLMLIVYTAFFVGIKPGTTELLSSSIVGGFFTNKNLLGSFMNIFG